MKLHNITHLLKPQQWIPLLSLLCMTGVAGAQVSTYTFSQPANPAGYVRISGGTAVAQAVGNANANGLDDVSYPVTLPFTFNFGNTAFTMVNVNTNGSLSFGTNASTSITAINDNTSGGGVVAAFNTDLRGIFSTTAATTSSSNVLTSVTSIGNISVGQTIAGTGIPAGTTITSIGTNTITLSASATATSASTVTVNIRSGHIDTATIGTAPNRIFIVQWTGFQLFGTANTSTEFQVRLAEGGGVALAQTVSIVYGNFLNLTGTGGAQVGLRANSGNSDFNDRTATTTWTSTTAGTTNADDVDYSSTNLPPSGLLFVYTPPSGCTGTPTPGTATAGANPVCAGSGTTTLTLTGTTASSGIGIQWMSSTDNITFTPIAGATLSTYTTAPAGGTRYYKAVVTCNGINPASSNTVTLTVSSPPVTASLPFTESFESWISACGTNDRPGTAWLTNPATGNNSWRRHDDGASASWTAPAQGIYSPVSSVGSYSARFHSRNAASGQEGTMDAYLNFSATGPKAISFDYINTNGADTLFVELSIDGGSVFTPLGYVTTSTTWAPQNFTTSATAANAIVRLRAKADGANTDIGVDNFFVTTCIPPTALNAGIVTPAGASLGFTPTGTPAAYQIQYGTATFAPGSGTNVFTTNNPYPLSGLTGGDSYSFFVRAICGPGDTSAYSTRFVFTTPCATATLPFAEQFNTYLPNNCWAEASGQLTTSAVLTGTTSAWAGDNYLNGAAVNPSAAIRLVTNTKRAWLITPSIDLGTPPSSGTSYVLEFNAGFVNRAATMPAAIGSDDTVAVVISTDNGATWSNTNIIKVFTAANTPVSTTGGQRFFIPLENYSGIIKIGFYASEGATDDAPDVDAFIDSILVRNCTRPTVNLGNDAIICPDAVVRLDAGNPGSTYLFSNNAVTQATLATAAGTYSVQIIDPVGCIGRDTIVLTAGVNPVVNLGNDTTICPATTITLDAGNAGSTYLYSNSATTQTTGITAGGTYDVFVINTQGCFGRDTIVITQGVNPVVNLGRDTAVCPGAATTITLDAGNTGSTYLYSNNATTQTITVTAAGTYSVRVTNADKCVGRDTIVVVTGANPVVKLGNDTTICPATTITLNAGNAGSRYLYSNSATTQTTGVTAGGIYDVRVTNAQGCIGRDTIVITQGVNPVVNLGNDTTLCPAATITLNAGNAGSTYLYSNFATTQTTTVTTAGTYMVRVTNTQKCIGRDTIVIFAGVNPVVNLGNDTAVCPGQTITLNAGNIGSTYLYNTGATTRTLAVNTSGTYSVRVTNATKCIGRDTIVIAQGADPIVNLGPDASTCDGTAITLDAGNPGSTYLYNTGATTRTLSVVPAGSYSVRVTNAQNCIGRDTINISVIPLATVNSITPAKTGQTVAFTSDAQNTTNYLWSFGDGNTNNTATPVHTYPTNGNYTVRLIVTNQCGSDTSETTVSITGVGTGSINLSSKELSIYPNPATSSITLDNKSALKMQSVTVLNVLGEVVLTKNGIAPKKETLDISKLPGGTYMVRIQTDGGSFLRKVQVIN